MATRETAGWRWWHFVPAAMVFLTAFGGLWALMPPRPRATADLGRPISSAICAPDGNTIALSGDSAVTMWDLAGGRKIVSVPTNAGVGPTSPWAFSHDGRQLATMYEANGQYVIAVWDIPSGRQRLVASTGRYPKSVVFSPDGRTLAILPSQGRPTAASPDTVTLWDLTTGQSRILISDPAGIDTLAFSPDGQTLAMTGFRTTKPGAVKLWDLGTGRERATLAVGDWPYILAFSPDGRTLAYADSLGGVGLWDLADGPALKLARTPNDGYFIQIIYAPDGAILLTDKVANRPFGLRPDLPPEWLKRAYYGRSLTAWDARTGRRLATLPNNHLFLTFVDDGRTLLTYMDDGTLQWWDVPPAPPWGPIFGWSAPIGLLTLALIWGFRRFRWRKKEKRSPHAVRRAE